MGKIIASYLVKVHVHAPDDATPEAIASGGQDGELEAPTNDEVKDAVIAGAAGLVVGGTATVSLIERTDD